ncbi:SICAvar, type I [Plasmodium knowlesi strain H]|uniref:SICAvar, type I n=3 Tax=Plasmodium knowlesi TaxID=5850 RepID=A0A5K1TUI6_PLAKH|nr:SICAvar, type I [Plasmodium knowlesi strain H]OTN65696.1 SICAvar type I [Plasmodium knowlesi]CAA9989445.1 SICAvar, type I [Plasmodium knowlesi strain H]SBO25077.1 SICAvar, type I [Plasmodium knowlesi strain H]SBO27828.1 SICAvar, type I [Plasmodium knowlesi strain H]VVS78919.1 SICAvar, type I [Plasmodium knowlesi strain H]|eukprot:XP_002260171.1 SICA antigen [Plasmodium knowlesi strain H]
MAAGATQPGAPNACTSALGDSEIQQSDQEGRGLREKWQEYLRTHSGNSGQSAQAVTLPSDLTGKVETMLETLRPYMQWAREEKSVLNACSTLKYPKDRKKEGHMKQICRVPVMIVNWMAGLDPQGKNKTPTTPGDSWEPYLRCIVGNSIIFRILKNKCEAQQMLKIISDTMAKGGSQPSVTGANSICAWVRMEDMEEVENLIGPALDQWLNNAKQSTQNGGISGVNNILEWAKCSDKQKQQENRQERKCSSDRIIELLGGGKSGALHKLVDPLAAAKACIQSYIDNIDKNNNDGDGKLCHRLQCIDNYLKATGAAEAEAAARKTSTSTDIWKEVRTQVTELVTNVEKNNDNTDADTLCNDITCPNGGANDCVSKTTCKIMAKALKEVHKNGDDDTNLGPLKVNNPIFRPTIRCVMLNAFAEKLKQHAQGKGYACAVEEGIEEALKKGEGKRKEWCKEGSGKEDGPCEPCGNKHQVCTAFKIGSTSLVGEVMYELNNNTPKIQKTLSTIEGKVTLCDRMNCIIKQLKPTDSSKKQNTGTTDAVTFWGENGDVKKLWDELAEKMKENGGSGNGQCGSFETDAEKKACNYLHAGFKELYEPTTTASSSGTANSEVLDNPSFRQTMGCFLLHAYANEMKKKAVCEIEGGIKKAFELGGTLSKTGTACKNGGKGPCVPCQWQESDYDKCQINIKGSTTATETAKEKVEKIIEEDTTNIEDMLSNINKRDKLCDHMKCIATHLNSTNGQKQKQSAEEFWTKDAKKLWEELVEEMKTKGNVDGSGNGDCKGFDNPSATVACNYLHVAFKKLKELSKSIKTDGTKYPILHKDPSFAQTVGCFLLHSYATHIKGKATCVIDEGIKRAFESWKPSKNGTCNGNGTEPCVPCQWEDDDYKSCEITTNGGGGTTEQTEVKPKVEGIVNKNDPDTDSIIKNINEMKTLCDGLKCIASHLNPSNGKQPSTTAQNFWTATGEVSELWNDLSKAMEQNGGQDKGGQCGQVDGSRQPTDPEKKACQHLTLGFNKLKDLSNSATSKGTHGKILSKDPLLKQAMGCLLLKEYARKMQGQSKCVIDSGLKKAFDSWKFNNTKSNCSGTEPCVPCQWNDTNIDKCEISIIDAAGETTQIEVTEKLTHVQDKINTTSTETLKKINEMFTLCDFIRCAGPKWFHNHKNKNGTKGSPTQTWCDFWENDGVQPELKKMFDKIASEGKNKTNGPCDQFGYGNEHSVERKACNHITAGLDYINQISSVATAHQNGNTDDDNFFKQSMMCAALNLYATKIKKETDNVCPIDEDRIKLMFTNWNKKNNSCSTSGSGSANNNNCFKCERKADFNDCDLLVDEGLIGRSTPSQPNGQKCTDNGNTRKEVQTQMNKLLQAESNMQPTLNEINEMASSFCTQVQCAIKKKLKNEGKLLNGTPPSWDALRDKIGKELTELLINMNDPKKQSDAAKYCSDKDYNWYTLGHKQSKTNKAACLHFAAGLQHIYTHGNGRVNGPSFEQTMGCLFLKEYAKQLQTVANEKKKGHSWVHPKCDIKEGIDHAFGKSKDIMKSVLPQCSKDTNGNNSCFVCTQNNDYGTCKIGIDSVKDNVEPLLQTKKEHMQQTLENTVCPILLTDLLTPFLPLAPVSIGLSAMAYYLWKYFGPLGKGGPRFRRSPGEIPGPSVQEQVLDHVQQEAGPHEYQLVKERKPPSAPTRTKRSGRVNRRTIIEIHFEVLDECQKGDTQLAQKDFLELLVQEFMGSELMDEEQVPMEEVLTEGVPMESIPLEQVPMERVPSLGSGLMV